MIRTLRTRLVLSSLTILVLFALVSSVLSMFVSRRIVDDAIRSSNYNELRILVGRLQKIYREVGDRVALFAQSDGLRTLVRDLEGGVGASQTSQRLERLNSHMRVLLYLNPEFLSLHTLTPRYLVSSLPSGGAVYQRGDYREISSTGGDAIRRALYDLIHVGQPLPTPDLIVAAPVEPGFLLACVVDLERLLAPYGDLVVMEPDGRIVAATTADRDVLGAVGRLSDGLAAADLVHGAAGQRSVVGARAPDGYRVFLATDTSPGRRRVRRAVVRVAVFSAVVLVVFGAVLRWLAGRVLRPLGELDEIFENVATYQDADIIAITDSLSSPLAIETDNFIVTSTVGGNYFSPIAAAIICIETLLSELVIQLGDKAMQRLNHTEYILEKMKIEI